MPKLIIGLMNVRCTGELTWMDYNWQALMFALEYSPGFIIVHEGEIAMYSCAINFAIVVLGTRLLKLHLYISN